MGKTISRVDYGGGQSGANIGFWAEFTDDSSGLFMLAIPEPMAVSMVLMLAPEGMDPNRL